MRFPWNVGQSAAGGRDDVGTDPYDEDLYREFERARGSAPAALSPDAPVKGVMSEDEMNQRLMDPVPFSDLEKRMPKRAQRYRAMQGQGYQVNPNAPGWLNYMSFMMTPDQQLAEGRSRNERQARDRDEEQRWGVNRTINDRRYEEGIRSGRRADEYGRHRDTVQDSGRVLDNRLATRRGQRNRSSADTRAGMAADRADARALRSDRSAMQRTNAGIASREKIAGLKADGAGGADASTVEVGRLTDLISKIDLEIAQIEMGLPALDKEASGAGIFNRQENESVPYFTRGKAVVAPAGAVGQAAKLQRTRMSELQATRDEARKRLAMITGKPVRVETSGGKDEAEITRQFTESLDGQPSVTGIGILDSFGRSLGLPGYRDPEFESVLDQVPNPNPVSSRAAGAPNYGNELMQGTGYEQRSPAPPPEILSQMSAKERRFFALLEQNPEASNGQVFRMMKALEEAENAPRPMDPQMGAAHGPRFGGME